jgi:hypothetical protein
MVIRPRTHLEAVASQGNTDIWFRDPYSPRSKTKWIAIPRKFEDWDLYGSHLG